MAVLANAQMTLGAAPGTGVFALGSATPGAQSFAAAGATEGLLVSYRAEEGAVWEIGVGTYQAAPARLVRTSVLASSADNVAATFTAAAIVSAVLLPGDIQAPLGFTPVRQGGGVGQGGNPLYLGWGSGKLLGQVDGLALGAIWTDQSCPVNKATNGYQVLASGLIRQWGYSEAASDVAITLPVTFPMNITSIHATIVYQGDPSDVYGISAAPNNLSSISFFKRRVNSGVVSVAPNPFYWTAEGY